MTGYPSPLRWRRRWLRLALPLVLSACGLAAHAGNLAVTLVSNGVDSRPRTTSAPSHDGSMSRDGRYLAFLSAAKNWGPNSSYASIFLADRQLGTTQPLALPSNGAAPDGSYGAPVISGDGNSIAFYSNATNLGATTTNSQGHIFVANRTSGSLEQVDVIDGGGQPDGVAYPAVAITPDGRYVAFISTAANLVPGDSNGLPDVFVRDRQAGTVERVSVGLHGQQTGLPMDARPNTLAISADGRYVSFISFDTSLTDQTGGRSQVYVRDRVAGTTELISVTNDGTPSDWYCYETAISDDGNQVLFTSDADNVAPNQWTQVLLRDRVQKTTEIVSRGASNAIAGAGGCHSPSISPDGRYVAFYSLAPDLVPGGTTRPEGVYRRDRQLGSTARIDQSGSGAAAAPAPNYDDPPQAPPALSSDGSLVAFTSDAPNLTAGDHNGRVDVFLRNVTEGTTARVSLGPAGVDALQGATSMGPQITDDGRYVAFTSDATNLVDSDRNANSDVFVWDRTSGVTERVSISSSGGESDGYSQGAAITPDGRYVLFFSHASNLAPEASGNSFGVYVRDRLRHTTERIDVSPSGSPADGDSFAQANCISADGRYVLFSSYAKNLVPGDTNGFADVFVRDRLRGTTRRVSLGAFGAQTGDDCYLGSLSADGRYATFLSDDPEVLPGSSFYVGVVVYRFDLLRGMLEAVSVTGKHRRPMQASGGQLSADGRFCLYAGSLTWGVYDHNLLLRDMRLGTTQRLDLLPNGQPASQVYSAEMSTDAHSVLFTVPASDLTPGGGPTLGVCIRDLRQGVTQALQVAGGVPDGLLDTEDVAMSRDARFLAFSAPGAEFAEPSTAGAYDVFLTDRGSSATGGTISVPATVSFGGVPVGTSLTRVVTIRNTGSTPLHVSIGAAAAAVPFAVSQAPRNATVAPGKSLQVRITFSPVGRTPATGTLVIDSSDPDHPEVVISLRGTGR